MARRIKKTADSRLVVSDIRKFKNDLQHPKDDNLEGTNSLIPIKHSQLLHQFHVN
jgi:hypothetical protein